MALTCPACGAIFAEDDEFCPTCGAPRAEARPPTDFATPQAGAPPSGRRSGRKWAAVGCIGLLAVALILAALFGVWLLSLLWGSQGATIPLPGLPGAEPTPAPSPTSTWPSAPSPIPTRPAATPTIVTPRTIEPAIIMPYCAALDQSPVYVRDNQPVTVYWGWLATTESYVQDFLDTATVEVSLDGEEVRPETQSDIQYDLEDEGYVVGWSADVGTLTPGSHRLDYHVSWSRQISDGWHTYGPGGDYEETQEHCEIMVQ